MILARVMDPQADEGFGGRASRVTNKAAMDDILRDWAGRLRKHLDAARGRSCPNRASGNRRVGGSIPDIANVRFEPKQALP
jgi:hypothetical protein